MFFKKRNFLIEPIGDFKWVNGYWYGEYNYLNKKITLCLDGSKEAPEKISIENLRAQIATLPLKVTLAEEYIESIDIEDLQKEYGEIIFDAISSKSELGSFDLEFGSTIWEDGYIMVHFKDDKPYEISRGD
jgi:thioredoxin reductase